MTCVTKQAVARPIPHLPQLTLVTKFLSIFHKEMPSKFYSPLLFYPSLRVFHRSIVYQTGAIYLTDSKSNLHEFTADYQCLTVIAF